jgi:hypothetical protein
MKLTQTAWATALAAVLAATSLSAHADKKEWAQKIVASQQNAVNDMARGVAEQPVRQMLGESAQILAHAAPEDKREPAAKQIEAEVKKYLDGAAKMLQGGATKSAQAIIGGGLEEKFSEDELKQLAGILENPTFKKFQSVIPELSRKLQEQVVTDARTQLSTKFQATGENVRKILDTATGGKLSAAAAQAKQQQGAASGDKAAAPKK